MLRNRVIIGSKETETFGHYEQVTVDFCCPKNKSVITDSFLYKCLFQASTDASSSDMPSFDSMSMYGFFPFL
jgi:hypothetical protein